MSGKVFGKRTSTSFHSSGAKSFFTSSWYRKFYRSIIGIPRATRSFIQALRWIGNTGLSKFVLTNQMKLTSVRGHGHLSVGQHEWSHCTGGNIGPSPVSASPRPSQRDISCPEIGRPNSGHVILNQGFYWLNDPCPYFQRPKRDKFLGSPWEIKSSSESWGVCVPNPRPIAKICWGKTINTFPC